MRVPDGRSVTVLLNATPILSDEGAVESMVVAMQDMADVEEQGRLRAEFLAMVSHELRAPLDLHQGIRHPRCWTRPPTSTPRWCASSSGSSETRLTTCTLWSPTFWTWPASRRARCRSAPNPPRWPCCWTGRGTASKGAGGRNSLAIDIEPDLPLVMADRRRIVQVLGNLLSNAARNSPESSVIRVSAVRDGVHVAFSVADEGRGIPAEKLPDLFRKFYGAQSEEQGGDTGLGLSICKGIVEAHGGRIWAESDGPGTGARFTFTLPIGGGSRKRRGPAGSHRSLRGVNKEWRNGCVSWRWTTTPTTSATSATLLAKSGYDPVVTGEPEEALRLVEEERPELVLLDLMLPGTDGIELMKDILDVVGRAGHLPVRLRTGGADRQGLRHGGYRLCRKAVLPDGALGENQGGPAQTGGRRAVGALCAGRPDRRLRQAHGDPCRPSRTSHTY